MSERVIIPDGCANCPFSFRLGPLHQCRLYNRGWMAERHDLPDYCRVKKIVVVEEDEDGSR